MRKETPYNYSFLFSFEKETNHEANRRWMENNWTSGFYYVGLYVVVIFGIQQFLKNRSKFELRGALTLWSAGLAIFSIVGAVRVIPEAVTSLTYDGFHYSVCSSGYITDHKVSGFWSFAFALSKLVELGDTVFIVLRKQPLIFLHWYHHGAVLLYTWFSYTDSWSSGRWMVVMNLSVHAVMYSYYTLKAMRFKLPKKISMVITSMQLVQMAFGCFINVSVGYYVLTGVECQTPINNVFLSFMMYLSFGILFARFFRQSYLVKERSKLY